MRKNKKIALNTILKDKEEQYIIDEQRKKWWIFTGVIILIIIFIIVYFILRKNLRYKEKQISEVHISLEEKEKIITQNIYEKEELEMKINDAYNEVIELAKNNDPTFYFRFQEVYPEFQEKLLDYNSGLRTSELILCAYTFLGFSIKDVAEYTYKSIHTVRNRKQNLRKKFNIPTETDMGIWLRDLIKSKEE